MLGIDKRNASRLARQLKDKGQVAITTATDEDARRIGAAAARKDRDVVLDALNATLTTCVGCHATYKQQIVDQATRTKLASMPAPTGEHAMDTKMQH